MTWKAFVLGLVLAASAGRASAATFLVNSTSDGVDVLPGDGTCATSRAECTLRAAIQEANALLGADTVELPAGRFALAIPGGGEDACATGDLDVLSDLTIHGAGRAASVISGSDLDRVLEVKGVVFEMSDLAVEHGLLTVGEGYGGGLRLLDASATIRNVEVRYCAMTLADAYGGGLASFGGSLLLEDAVIRDNSSTGSGGGLAVGNATVRRCLIESNRVIGSRGYSGGIGIGGGVVDRCIIRHNVATVGGGISVSGGAMLLNSLIEGNVALETFAGSPAVGGGVFCSGNPAILENDTISGNSAISVVPQYPHDGTGGGIFIRDFASLSARHVTVTANFAGGSGGGVAGNTESSDYSNCLIAGNQAFRPDRQDITGYFRLVGPLLVGLRGDAIISGDPTLLIESPDTRILPLADNGGPTWTHALALGSSALDSAADTSCVDVVGAPLAADQRGALRPFDADGDGAARCDFGAYELQLTCSGPDSDGDRVPDACDCAPSDPGSWQQPPEPTLLVTRVGATQPHLTWTSGALAVGTTSAHDIASDLIATMHVARGATASCVDTGLAATSIDDMRDLSGLSVYYLVRATNACTGPGLLAGWGTDSLGNPRPTCP